MKKTRRIISLFLTAAMIIRMVGPQAAITAKAETVASSSSKMLSLDETQPEGLATTENPYGYAEDVAFTLSSGTEALYYSGWSGKHETKVLNTDSTSGIGTFVNHPPSGTGSYSVPEGTWNWVQAVAFDSSVDDAKDDKVLFVGVKKDQYAYAWVLDYNKNTIIGPTKLGNMSWIGTDYDQYSSTSLFDVAAGDFNGDGIDTLLVYVPLNLNSSEKTGCTLYELTFDGSSLKLGSSGNHLLMDQYITDQKNLKYKDVTDTDDTCRDKLAVSMQVGDYNGDNVDDLAVLSYSHYRYSKGSTAYYSPQLKISYGDSNATNISKLTVDETFTIANTSGSTLTFPVAASLAAGDFNGDSYDDLYVVGVKSTATTGSSISSISVSGDKWYLHRLNGNSKSKLENAGYTTINSNAWFEDGFYASDYCYGEVMAAGVATSGNAAPETLFIAGSLYDVSTGTPVLKLTGSYFKSGDQGVEAYVATNTFVQSVVVGNFDNNEAGREQVMFIVGMKQSGHDNYWFKSGYMCGTDFADGTYSDDSTYYGAAGNYYCSSVDDADYIHSKKGDDPDEGLNCLFIALDYDDDSVIAKYRGANYVYTDPAVSAVLQAAPYFGDISTYGKNSTGYTIETTYSWADTATNNLNASVGVAFSGGAPLIASASGAVGVKGGWSASVTETYKTNYKETFAASSEDVVIVNRTPLFVYQYDIMNSDGTWDDKTKMEFTIPQEPVYETLTIDAYNAFAEEYNNMMAEAGVTDYMKLGTIDAAANWMDGNEGNPYAYNQSGWSNNAIDAKKISTGSYTLGKANAATTINWTVDNSTTQSFTATVGFYLKESVTFGAKGVLNFGVDLAGDYTHGWGYSEVNGTAVGSSCTVQDLNGTALLADGMDQATLDLYSFTWTFGQWSRDLGMKDEDGNSVNTVFLGYSLTNVSSPPMAVEDFSGTAPDENTIRLSWQNPDTPDGWPGIDGYVIYSVTEGSDGTLTYENIKEIAGQATSVDITSLKDNKAIEPNTEYSFCMRPYHSTDSGKVYGVMSDVITVQTPVKSYYVYAECEGGQADISIVKQGGTQVVSGDKVLQDTIIRIKAETASEQYKITALKVKDTATNEEKTIEPDEGGQSVIYYHKMTGDISITVCMEEIFNEAEVTFTDAVYDGDTLMGTVTATVDGYELTAPGGIVDGPVTFTATAAEGYVHKSWNVTIDGTTTSYAADGQSDLTVELTGSEIVVEAVFAEKEQVHQTITVKQPDEGGKIALYDADGVELVPGENGTYDVIYDTAVTFKAIPDTGYVISAWTDDVADQTEESFTLNITKDITVGITYRAPVKYKLTYTSEDENGNFVTVSPYVASGSGVAAGTELTLSTAAADGYYIEKWTITQGTEVVEYALEEEVREDSRTVTMDAATTVEVTFAENSVKCTCVNLTDVSEGDWFHDAVVYVVEKGLMEKTDSNTFSPNEEITRAMMVQIFYNLEGKPEVNVTDKYIDVDADSLYAKAIAWATEKGIITGTGDKTFSPDDRLTKVQIVRMLHLYAEYKGLDVDVFDDTALTLSGTPSRAEIAKMIMRLDSKSVEDDDTDNDTDNDDSKDDQKDDQKDDSTNGSGDDQNNSSGNSSKDSQDKAAKTGDDQNIMLWGIMMVLAAGALAVIGVMRKRRN